MDAILSTEQVTQLDRMIAASRLNDQADRLVSQLYRAQAVAAAANSERQHRIQKVRAHALDRASRRHWNYWRISQDKPVVTTAQVYAWMWANLAAYAHGLDGVDSAEIAGAATEALDIWDAEGSIPLWVWRCGEVVSVREEERRQRRMATFVEKPIRYEADGDVLWK